MEKILSIVVPTYNMEKYLRKCLDSLIVSDENMQRLEVLVINDGSKDSSSQIAHEYEARYPRTFRVIDKENGNYGSCINRGLKESIGKYIKILDADDCFSTDVFESFIVYLANIDVDLVLSDYDKVDEIGNVLSHHNFKTPKNQPLLFENFCNSRSIHRVQMHAVTYKTENLKKNGYCQTEGISYTDQEWIFLPMTTVNSFLYFSSTLYLYLIGREGQTVDSNVFENNMGQFVKMVFSLAKTYDKIQNRLDYMEDYLHYKLKVNVGSVYNRALLKRNINMRFVADFDFKLKKISIDVYQITQNIVIHEKFPYKFVDYYRKHKTYLPFYVNWLYKIMRGCYLVLPF